MNDLYTQEILEHYRHPQNFGKLKKPTAQVYHLNPLCGDEITLQILFDKRGAVKDIKFFGAGCALSTASASLFTENFKGQSLTRLKKIQPELLVKNLGVKVSPSRAKCVLLPYQALKQILAELKSTRLPLYRRE